KGKVTLYAEGDITVGENSALLDDLIYSDRTTDLLGLLTTQDIVLNCFQPAGGQCRVKTVHGLLRAGAKRPDNTGGTIYNNKWDKSLKSDLGPAPKLTFFGAMISGYRGTFGAMDSSNEGNVSSGWSKDFEWDPRLESQQPPYMLRD